ncbi:MAG TPA: cation:proton antiporter [Gemmatimonadaceae bacterium]|nr:cation:proton antiporter [Gemmatimonadaceae bacterium]
MRGARTRHALTGRMESFRSHALGLPLLVKFAIGLGIIVIVPQLCRRLRIPAVVGLLLSGVLFGPYGLEIIGKTRPVADFLGELGKILLMFMAGLEIDLALFKRVRKRSMTFGVITTSLPLILGTVVGLVFGYAVLPAIVIGSLLASHTLLASSTITRLGETKLEPITITYGATVFSDTSSLIVFAVCASTFQRGFSVPGLSLLLAEIAIFVPLILFGLSRVGAAILARVEDDEAAYFAVMIAIVAAASSLAEAIQLPDIVGAFLSGLALNAAVKEKAARRDLEFIGGSLFIPIFFITTGFLIDPRALVLGLASDLPLVLSIVGALVVAKFAAAEITGRLYGYTRDERLTIWSLTLPQVAATLAAALVAYKMVDPAGARLLDDRMLNVVLALMLCTSILGPVLTEHYAPRLLTAKAAPSGGEDQPQRQRVA